MTMGWDYLLLNKSSYFKHAIVAEVLQYGSQEKPLVYLLIYCFSCIIFSRLQNVNFKMIANFHVNNMVEDCLTHTRAHTHLFNQPASTVS